MSTKKPVLVAINAAIDTGLASSPSMQSSFIGEMSIKMMEAAKGNADFSDEEVAKDYHNGGLVMAAIAVCLGAEGGKTEFAEIMVEAIEFGLDQLKAERDAEG